MLNEPIFDALALLALLVTAFRWGKVFRSYRAMPGNWVGPHQVFAQRIRRERFWTRIGWAALGVAVIVVAVDLSMNSTRKILREPKLAQSLAQK